jgi:DNA-binding response OmpR family regulator
MARILLVDDEEYVRQLYSEELVEEGHEVVTAASGHDLLRRIDLLQPEVVLLDIRLVDYDGLELLQDIAYDTYKYDPKAMVADYYVIKSFNLTDLKVAIRKAIEAEKSVRLTA